MASDSAEQLRLTRLRQARDLIDGGYAGRLDLRALAREAGYSPFHFARSFREAYGATPSQYLTRRRVERARDLLRSANLTVTEVCYAVGFASLGSFSARFKQQVGVPPSVYRDEAVRRGGPPRRLTSPTWRSSWPSRVRPCSTPRRPSSSGSSSPRARSAPA